MKKLSERQLAVLEVLATDSAEVKRGLYAGRVARLAGFKHSQRMDAGATRTLDSLGALVKYEYGWEDPSRRWWITDKGREALAEFAFGEPD